jgi:hypothetical protein
LISFDRNKVAPFIGLRNAIGITIPLAVGVTAGTPDYGLVASMSAMNVSYSDGSDPYVLRVRRMLAATLLSVVGYRDWLSVCTSFASSHCRRHSVGNRCRSARCISETAADIGLLSLVLLLVYSGQQLSMEQAIHSGLFAIAGGLLQILFSVSLANAPL